ncbi:endonuclease domain-containing protein [Marinomonas atlantica]|uniref:endonuclease domain-containing protein n=1 Tax=Marinomonas atlantica TaxID=1806668 RepID=UPI0008327E2A|nr:endonuclease domain-containing protein [Marinomonas atlantica]
MTKIYNQKRTKDLRSQLRTNMTEPERRLWSYLRKNQLGVKVRRQFGIGRYIVDFYCPAKRLVIEVDGDSHYTEEGMTYDQERDQYMASLGICVMRFTNQQVMQEMEAVVGMISAELKK